MIQFELVLEQVKDEYTGEPTKNKRALLFTYSESVKQRGLLYKVIESEEVRIAVAAVTMFVPLSHIGIQDAEGNVTIPDEISLSEAAQARYNIW